MEGKIRTVGESNVASVRLVFTTCQTMLLHCAECTKQFRIGDGHYVSKYGVPFCKECVHKLIREGRYECVGRVPE